MNEYFDYIGMDSEYTPAYPSDNIYKKTVMQKNVYPNKLQNIMDLQNKSSFTNPNTNNNMQPSMNNSQNCGLLNSTEGTFRGNMFPNLYDPYKTEGPKRFIPTNEKERQMFEVQKSCFAMQDIKLYLDIHPDDACMINLYNKYLKEYKKALNDYEAQYGPVTTDSNMLNTIPWAWEKTMAPWERGN